MSLAGQYLKTEPTLEITGVDEIQVPVSGGGSNTIFSSGNADVETEQKGEAVVAQFSFKPGEALQYHFRLGQLQNFQLEFSSGSSINKLESLKNGFMWGFGFGGRFSPGSIVSTAISWQIDYNRKTIDLDRFTSTDLTSASSIRLEEEEYQGAVNFSRRWKMIQPYGGLKILRTVTRLKDRSTAEKVSGTTDGVSPFLGLQWWFAEKETLVIEGSLMDEESVSAAFKVQF